MKPKNKYCKLVKMGRGEWITKWFGTTSTSTEPVNVHNLIEHGEYIVGFRRYSTDEETYFNREYLIDEIKI